MKPRLIALAVTLAYSAAGSVPALAASVGIADWPLTSGTAVQVKPNLLFILDDSGSMGSEYLPDSASSSGNRCYKNHLYNKVFYNPDYTYPLPVDYLGNTFPPASFTAAKTDGFKSSSSTVNLSTSFNPDGGSGEATQAAYYYKYTGSAANDGKTCYSSTNYTKVVVSASEQQNFANWYSYYRSRQLMMRSAVGLAFKDIGDDFRIGFITIWNKSPVPIKDFTSTQKQDFYAKLYAATSGGMTPLRTALSTAGRIYAAKETSLMADPVQYSCQQNFAFLSSDGYWNDGDSKNLSGGKVGDQDSGLATPKKDALAKPDTLADVAAYYRATDLRTSALGNCTGAPVGGSSGNVCGVAATWTEKQTMVTFTLGLGLDGNLTYAPDYKSGGSADYNAIVAGSKNWGDPITNTTTARTDDMWHAAVNGEGTYFSAKTPEAVSYALVSALTGVAAAAGSGGAPAMSNLDPVAGDNLLFLASYRSKLWDGDLSAYEIDVATGLPSTTKKWSAQAKIDSAVVRNVMMNSGGGLVPFSAANLASAISAKYFDAGTTNPGGALNQYASMTAAQKANATPASLINFVLGSDANEDQASVASPDQRLYRDREHRLGDIVNSSPVYQTKPPFSYLDAGYSDFVTANASRQKVIYAGANDGMLHALNAETGDEMWAYVPTAVIPNLYKLADKGYPNNHKYYVDGALTLGDACFSAPTTGCTGGTWTTMLVGGLGKGGRSFYALDVTSPSSPKLLWEITSATPGFGSLGFSYGKPLLAKQADTGKWVVIFASGYDNVSPGDGAGRIYVVDAKTGAKISEIVADAALNDPSKSGIARLSAWSDDALRNNATRYVYGGDLSGNVWRFDLQDGTSAKLASLVAGGKPQPITTKLELGEVWYKRKAYRVIFAGTGKYLTMGDITDSNLQSMYAIKDTLTSTWGDFRSAPGVVKQNLTAVSTTSRSVSASPVDWTTAAGWYVDFDLTAKERANVDPVLLFGTLVFITNVPDNDACNVGGTSWLYTLDFATGGLVKGATDAASFIEGALSFGFSTFRIKPSGETESGLKAVVPSAGKPPGTVRDIPYDSTMTSARRVFWRELETD